MIHVEHDAPLKACNTFGLEARAAHLVRCRSEDAVREAAALARGSGWPVFVLGGGSNIVLARDWPGLMLKVEIGGIDLLEDDGEVRRVRAGAGESWHGLVMHTLQHGWPGLENLALIPGSVGAAPVQNIGAYGVELDSVFESLRALDLASGEVHHFDRQACRFGYRDSVFKHEAAGRYAILDVTLRLPVTSVPRVAYADLRRHFEERRVSAPDASAVAQAVMAIRQAKLPDPARIGNAGSFFKNPVVDARTHAALKARFPELVSYAQPADGYKLAAGWLIDTAGWKGRAMGGAAVYEKQALVLVNRGGATGADVLRLSGAIQADVRDRFGVELEPEPVVVGLT